jgi:acetyl esterase/lipase
MLLNVHGGAWSGGDKNSGKVVDEALAASGLVVVSIDLPIAPLYPYPGQVVHTNWATRWLKLNATDLNGDPRSVGGMGLSSGGHAIMLSALKPNDSRYAAIGPEHSAEVDATLSYVILRYPVLDPYVRYGYAKDVGREPLIRGTEGYFLTEEAMHEGNAQELLD